MKHHHLRLLLLSLAVGGSSSVFAQSNDLSYIFTARPKYTFSAALKIRTSGANVKFGNLGTIPVSTGTVYTPDATGKLVLTGYKYQDGVVAIDAARSTEVSGGVVETKDDKGNVTSTSQYVVTPTNGGLRYATSIVTVNKADPANPVTTIENTGDFLAYQAGQTRSWSYVDTSQAVNGGIDMHNYGANSEGASREAESGSSGGFDLQLAREIGQIGKKGQWGISFSFGVNDFNAKTSGRIKAALLTQAFHFSLRGQTAPTAPYTGPTYTTFNETDGNGQPFIDNTLTPPAQKQNPTGLETTVPIADTPVVTDPKSDPGKADIDGTWKAKGAYYMMRLGPSFRYQLTKRISFFGNAGFAAGYYGSVFSLTETLAVPTGVPNRVGSDGVTPQGGPSVTGEIRDRSVKFGYYGELNLEFWMTYRTGLFAGVVYEHLGKFRQTLGGRTADVDIGGGTAFRVGIINRF